MKSDLEPQAVTAREYARAVGISEAKAHHDLEAMTERGLFMRAPDDSYIVTGLGLWWGELAGVVKPFDPVHGYQAPPISRKAK